MTSQLWRHGISDLLVFGIQVSTKFHIRRKRLETSYDLIRQGYGAQQAGYASGYTDYSAFYRAFCQQYGFPPGELSARIKPNHRKEDSQEREA